MVNPAPRQRSAGDVCEPCNPQPGPPRPSLTVRVSLFFDGTLNNRANTRTYATSTAAQNKGREGSSYANDYSNISKLEEVLKLPHAGFDRSFKIYIEGIGTFDDEDDSTYGAATGRGDYGVPAKVERGMKRCVDLIKGIPSSTTISQIVLDAFGFSRGAAAARNFVHKALKADDHLAQRLRSAGYTVGPVIVRFVGLFDTVASYDINHDNDTAELKLDAIKSAEKVVQLAAGEEHRAKFRLTNIASAGDDGVEHYLPGVHSDIGGGYVDEASENLQLFELDVTWVGTAERAALDREVTWALDRGWYELGEFEANRGMPARYRKRTGLENGWNEILVSRTRISNLYARIPLHIMAEYACNKQLVWSSDLGANYPIPEGLAAVKTTIEGAVRSCPAPDQDTWMDSLALWHITLRHAHLHMSSYYGSTAGANTPQWTDDDPVKGRRRRVVQAG